MMPATTAQQTGFRRFRRLRQNASLRRFARETLLDPGDFVYPLFVTYGQGIRREVTSMPDVHQISVDQLAGIAEELADLGVRSVLLFGIPESKDPLASDACSHGGVVQQAIRELKRVEP